MILGRGEGNRPEWSERPGSHSYAETTPQKGSSGSIHALGEELDAAVFERFEWGTGSNGSLASSYQYSVGMTDFSLLIILNDGVRR